MLTAVRGLWRRPALALGAVLTIGLGIGANVAVYRVVYAVLLEPLPFRDPGRLVQVWETTPALPQLQVTAPDLADWRARSRSFAEVGAYTLAAMNHITLLGQGEPEVIHATMSGHELFPAMGIQPLAGRGFTAEEERTQAKVGLLSEDLWRRKFGADRGVVGRQIRLEGQSFTVIGVVSKEQGFPAWADFWMPLSFLDPDMQARRKYHPLEVIARLKPGVTAEAAQAEIAGIAKSLAREHADTNGVTGAYVMPLASGLTGEVRPSLLLVWAAVGLVLLIACANLAHLVLARMLERREEMAMRAALGAGPGHLIRLVLAESLWLAAAGGAVGMVLAAWTSEILSKLAAGQIPRLEQAGFQGPVVVFAAAVSAVCGLLFGVPACWQVWRANFGDAPAARTVVRPRSRLASLLITAEVALAFVVAAGALVLVRGFAGLLNENAGFDGRRVIALQTPCNCGPWLKSEAFFNARLVPAVRALAGVEDAAAVNSVPMSLGRTEHSRFATRFAVAGRSYAAGAFPVAQIRWVTPEYFRVLGIPLKRGEWLKESEKPRILVNEALARRWLSAQDAVGQSIVLGVMDAVQTTEEIAGVVGDVRELGVDEEVPPMLYELDASPVMSLLVKIKSGGEDPLPGIRAIIHRLDPEIAVGAAHPLEQYVSESLARRRFAVMLMGIFAGLAAVLMAAGTYSLLAYSVSRRLREFGVRAAMGAAPGELAGMIVREAAGLALPGLLAGALGFVAFARWMQSLVSGVSAADPRAMGGAALLLSMLVLVSAWLPGRRAARTEPSAALRAD